MSGFKRPGAPISKAQSQPVKKIKGSAKDSKEKEVMNNNKVKMDVAEKKMEVPEGNQSYIYYKITVNLFFFYFFV